MRWAARRSDGDRPPKEPRDAALTWRREGGPHIWGRPGQKAQQVREEQTSGRYWEGTHSDESGSKKAWSRVIRPCAEHSCAQIIGVIN